MSNQLCVHCGENYATTDDHIPPRGIYPKPRPNNIKLHTVPACEECNSGAGVEDEEFKVFVGLSTGEFRDNQYQVIDSIAKTVGSNQKIANQIFRSKIDVYARSGSFVYRPAVTVTFNSGNYCKVIQRIVRGLYWRQTSKFLGKTTKINVFPLDEMKNEFFKSMQELMDCLQSHRLNQDTFIYKVRFIEDGTSIWGMQFFGRHTVFAYAEAPEHNLQ